MRPNLQRLRTRDALLNKDAIDLKGEDLRIPTDLTFLHA